MPDLPASAYVPAFSGLALAVAVLYYDNKMLIRELVALTKSSAEAISGVASVTHANTEAVDRLTDRIDRAA